MDKPRLDRLKFTRYGNMYIAENIIELRHPDFPACGRILYTLQDFKSQKQSFVCPLYVVSGQGRHINQAAIALFSEIIIVDRKLPRGCGIRCAFHCGSNASQFVGIVPVCRGSCNEHALSISHHCREDHFLIRDEDSQCYENVHVISQRYLRQTRETKLLIRVGDVIRYMILSINTPRHPRLCLLAENDLTTTAYGLCFTCKKAALLRYKLGKFFCPRCISHLNRWYSRMLLTYMCMKKEFVADIGNIIILSIIDMYCHHSMKIGVIYYEKQCFLPEITTFSQT